jgi:hypothetical protein
MTARIITDVRKNVLSIPIIALTTRAHQSVGDSAQAMALGGHHDDQAEGREGVFVIQNGIASSAR